MTQRVPITVRLESFEGPLDLLLYLIQSHELNISTVSISRITDQYLAYIRLMKDLNFDTASEFLVMASTLLHWKSKSLLPDENATAAGAEAGDELAMTQEELVRQLLEHQRFRAAGGTLAGMPWLGIDTFKRPTQRPPVEKVWKEMNITDLGTTYQDILVRARRRVTILKKETVSLSDKIREFKERLPVGKLTEMSALWGPIGARPEVVVTFLASLELSRLKKLRIFQEQTYGVILLELLESLHLFDENMASGFDNPNPPAPEAGIQPDYHGMEQIKEGIPVGFLDRMDLELGPKTSAAAPVLPPPPAEIQRSVATDGLA